MDQPFRFVHASDFHLERPVRGLAEVPDHLREALIDAPYRAAERVFDTAVKERVDFVVLCGDLFDPFTAGPRALVFLDEQFRRLADKGIQTYWAGGRSDDVERWGDHWPLGDHVRRFASHRVERLVHQRDGQPLVQVLGTSVPERRKIRSSDFHTDPRELFTVAVAYGAADADALARHAVNYWALGGEHDRRLLATAPVTAHYCGSPQGRRPQEAGPHGCTLVQVDETRRVRTSFVPTDAVRFQQERVMLSETTTPEQLHQILEERVVELLGDPFGPELLIHWTVSGSAALAGELRRGKLAADLTARLRAEHGQKRPAAWTLAIEPDTSFSMRPELYDEETVLGEFLRSVRRYVEHPEEALNLEAYLPERYLAGTLGAAAALDDPAVRKRVLQEVTRLGLELLSPQEHGS
jgi:exonuclease SbcD